jgi:hypothetical protein
MFRYLRIQAHIHQSNIAQRMLDHGSYTFLPRGSSLRHPTCPFLARLPVPLLMSSPTTRLMTKPTTIISLPISPSLPACGLGSGLRELTGYASRSSAGPLTGDATGALER